MAVLHPKAYRLPASSYRNTIFGNGKKQYAIAARIEKVEIPKLSENITAQITETFICIVSADVRTTELSYDNSHHCQ